MASAATCTNSALLLLTLTLSGAPFFGTPPVVVADFTAEQRLVVVNGCSNMEAWIASSATVPGSRSVKLAPGQTYAYTIPLEGLSSTRFWPKMLCNEAGEACKIGSSGGVGQDCPVEGCAPPVDSKFEASFGCVGAACHPGVDGNDWWDTSAVDGFTIPYKVEVDSKCPGAKMPDCSGLHLEDCPGSEDIVGAGKVDLRVRLPGTGEVVGCYSPCGKLTYSNWANPDGIRGPADTIAAPYCCPTPPESPEACRAGPVEKTSFVQLIHQRCANVYGYAYDDLVGLQVCPAGTRYTWTIMCPGLPGAPVIF